MSNLQTPRDSASQASGTPRLPIDPRSNDGTGAGALELSQFVNDQQPKAHIAATEPQDDDRSQVKPVEPEAPPAQGSYTQLESAPASYRAAQNNNPPPAPQYAPAPVPPQQQSSVSSSAVQGSVQTVSAETHNLMNQGGNSPQQNHTLQAQQQYSGSIYGGQMQQQQSQQGFAPSPTSQQGSPHMSANFNSEYQKQTALQSNLRAMGATPNTIGEVDMPNLRKRMNPSKFCWCYPMDKANQWMFVISIIGAFFAFIFGCVSMWGAAYLMPNCAMLILVGILAFKCDRTHCPHTRQTLCFALMLVNFVIAILAFGWIFWAFGIFCHTAGDWNSDASIAFISLFWYGCWIPVHLHWLGVANSWRESHGGAAITDVVIGTAMIGKRWEKLAQEGNPMPEGAQSFKHILQNTVGVQMQDLNEWRKQQVAARSDDGYSEDNDGQKFHQRMIGHMASAGTIVKGGIVDIHNKIRKKSTQDGSEDGMSGLHDGLPVGEPMQNNVSNAPVAPFGNAAQLLGQQMAQRGSLAPTAGGLGSQQPGPQQAFGGASPTMAQPVQQPIGQSTDPISQFVVSPDQSPAVYQQGGTGRV